MHNKIAPTLMKHQKITKIERLYWCNAIWKCIRMISEGFVVNTYDSPFTPFTTKRLERSTWQVLIIEYGIEYESSSY